jgi:glycerophosphoryl diester phosphodiesterase
VSRTTATRAALSVLIVITAVMVVVAGSDRRLPHRPFLAGTWPAVVAHRGASADAPENTLEAFSLALDMGADILELDVHETSDGVPVVIHDDTIDRTSDGAGRVAALTLAELRRYDFGYAFSPDGGASHPYRGEGVRIPTLEEVLEKLPRARVNAEIKQVTWDIERQVWEVVRRQHAEDRILITATPETMRRWLTVAGDRTAVVTDADEAGRFVGSVVAKRAFYRPAGDMVQLPLAWKLGSTTIPLDTPEIVARAHSLNLRIDYWTIDDDMTMRRLFTLGADAITTNRPDHAVKVLRSLGLRNP